MASAHRLQTNPIAQTRTSSAPIARLTNGVAADVDSMPLRRKASETRVRTESPKSRAFRELMSMDVRTREEIAKLHKAEEALRDRLSESVRQWLEVYGRSTSDGTHAHHRFMWEGEIVRPVYRRVGKGTDRMSGFIQRFPPVGIDEGPDGSDDSDD